MSALGRQLMGERTLSVAADFSGSETKRRPVKRGAACLFIFSIPLVLIAKPATANQDIAMTMTLTGIDAIIAFGAAVVTGGLMAAAVDSRVSVAWSLNDSLPSDPRPSAGGERRG